MKDTRSASRFPLVTSLSLGFVAASLWSSTAALATHHQHGTQRHHRDASLHARLIDAAKKAEGKAATVQVNVVHIKLVDPATTHEMARRGQGHLHYKMDGGPIIATTTTKLSFHALSSGHHTLAVMLAGNDHQPLGPQETLEFDIP